MTPSLTPSLTPTMPPAATSTLNAPDTLNPLKSNPLPIGCVIMASGEGRRFGSNKLMADIGGAPMISHILDITGDSLFAARVVVTRHAEIRELCEEKHIPVILHDHPELNHTIRLGLSHVMPGLAGCMFTVSDQPRLTRESLEHLVLTFSRCQDEGSCDIVRLCHGSTMGNPVLFGQNYFEELLHLPEGKGGGILLKKYKERIRGVDALFEEELWDIDTREDMNRIL